MKTIQIKNSSHMILPAQAAGYVLSRGNPTFDSNFFFSFSYFYCIGSQLLETQNTA